MLPESFDIHRGSPMHSYRSFDPEGVALLLRTGSLRVHYADEHHGVSVTVLSRGVASWSRRWPCFGPTRAIYFAFDQEGNLEDTSVRDDVEGSGALALAEDTLRATLIKRKLAPALAKD